LTNPIGSVSNDCKNNDFIIISTEGDDIYCIHKRKIQKITKDVKFNSYKLESKIHCNNTNLG